MRWTAADWTRAALAWALALLVSLPTLWMLGTAFKPPGEFTVPTLALLPREWTLQHVAGLLDEQVWRRAWNSVVVALGATVLALLVALPAAYALARLRFPARLDAVFLLFVLVVKLMPPIVLAVPLFQVLRGLGLLDTQAGLIVAHQVYALPFAIWMLVGFVREVPEAIEEAAMIDGAGPLRRLVDIVLPMLAPGLAATAIFVAILSWNEFLFALLFMQSPSNFTLPSFIATRINEDETLWGSLAAIGLLSSLPILLLARVVLDGMLRDAGTSSVER